jgi:hypothetical protein
MRLRTRTNPICVTCGEPTGRHYSAIYCWDCMAKSNREAVKRRCLKQKTKRDTNTAERGVCT